MKKKKQNEMGNVLYEIRQLSTFATLSTKLKITEYMRRSKLQMPLKFVELNQTG